MHPLRNKLAMIGCVLCLTSGLESSALAGFVLTFSDETFEDTEWSISNVVGAAGGQTAEQVATGGNSGTTPDPFRAVRTNTSSSVRSVHYSSANVYDPSAGAVESIDFSIDFRNINFFGQGQAFHMAIEQAGVHYISTPQQITAPGGNNWTNFQALGLTEDNFILATVAPGTPDFSSAGAPMTFGFATANTGGNGIEVGYDNWRVSVTAVPEPSSGILVAVVCAVPLIRRHRSASR